jgi:preprotein translocase subunit SecG
MLSFLREQSGANAPSRKEDAAVGKPSAGGGEPSQEEQYLTVASHGGRTRRSTILLAVLFIAGLLCLWFMIKKSTPSAAVAITVDTEEEVQVETALARLTGFKSELFKRMDEIVRKFYEFSNVLQVQVSELAKDPFALELNMTSAKKEPEVKEVPKIDPAVVWRQEVERKAKDMKLLSIVQSDKGTCCMIGDTILRRGESLQGFKVRQIGEDFVKLQWEPERDDRPPSAEQERIEIILKLRK